MYTRQVRLAFQFICCGSYFQKQGCLTQTCGWFLFSLQLMHFVWPFLRVQIYTKNDHMFCGLLPVYAISLVQKFLGWLELLVATFWHCSSCWEFMLHVFPVYTISALYHPLHRTKQVQTKRLCCMLLYWTLGCWCGVFVVVSTKVVYVFDSDIDLRCSLSHLGFWRLMWWLLIR